jgi:hypothetical protein
MRPCAARTSNSLRATGRRPLSRFDALLCGSRNVKGSYSHPCLRIWEAAAGLTQTSKPSPQATRDKFRGRMSTSYIDWATLMRCGLGLDVLDCPRCHDRMRPVAVPLYTCTFRSTLAEAGVPDFDFLDRIEVDHLRPHQVEAAEIVAAEIVALEARRPRTAR